MQDSKGGPMYEANLFQVASALESMPRVLEGKELEALAAKLKDSKELTGIFWSSHVSQCFYHGLIKV